MSKNKEKLAKPPSELREALAALAARPEFKAFEKLCRIEENNIVLQSFKINSGDVDIARKKAWHEGRLWELRKMLKTFEDSRRKERDEEEGTT